MALKGEAHVALSLFIYYSENMGISPYDSEDKLREELMKKAIKDGMKFEELFDRRFDD